LDTRFFPSDFTSKLLASDTVLGSASSLDEATDGLLIQSENFQALRLIAPLFKGNFKCVYIDPPYNTDSGPIDYKNGYKSSTWATLIANRLALTPELMRRDAVLCATIDDFQQKELHYLIEQCFGGDHLAGTVVIRSNPAGRPVPSGFAQSHEYAIFAMRSSESQICKLPRSERQAARYRHQDSVGSFMWELFRKRGTASEKAERPSLYYPIYVSGESVRVPAMKFDEGRREWVDIELPSAGEIVAFPIDESGTQRRWRGAPSGIRDNPTDYKAVVENGTVTIYYKFYPGSDGVLPSTSWIDPKYSATEYGTGVLKEFFTEYDPFSYPKSVYAVEDCLRVMGMSDGEGTVLDYFAGSGTTAHAIINLNRQDGGKRKYVLVEVDDHFRTVLKPRLQKVVYSKDWKGGNPVSREGSSHMFKYIRLESYEDSLNNLRLKPRTPAQQTLLDGYSEMREAYLLRYMLNVEADASPSLLSVDGFEDPFNYGMQIATGTVGETRPVVVDLVETFNYLIGLRVRRVAHIHGFRLVEGRSPGDKKVLIIWRNTKEKSNGALDAFFREHYSVAEDGFQIIYVNGDNNLQNLRLPEEHWEVRLIEEEFLKRMFDGRDV
jgi:adenine-specific DNA-methyltransferase